MAVELTKRNFCDLKMLANGAFHPLTTFMAKADYDSVLRDMRLSSGELWPIPITLCVGKDHELVSLGATIDLIFNDVCVGKMDVQECFPWSIEEEARRVFGKLDLAHPTIVEMQTWGPVCISGPIAVFPDQFPKQPETWEQFVMGPCALKQSFIERQCRGVVAFQTRNPMHRAHEELTKRAVAQISAQAPSSLTMLLIQPVVGGLTRPGDVDEAVRAETYITLVRNHYDPKTTVLNFLPLAMRMAGPREALWHAIIRKNYGATHFIVGRDHAGPGPDSQGKPFFGPYEAKALVSKHQDEIGVEMIPFQRLVYVPEKDRYEEDNFDLSADATAWSISGTQAREDYINRGIQLPEWFTRPETAAILAKHSTAA